MRLKEKARSLLEGGGNAIIEYTKEDKTAIFTINRPDKMNVLNVEAMRQFTDLLKEFRDDDSLWVGILTGTGEKVSVPVSTSRIFFP